MLHFIFTILIPLSFANHPADIILELEETQKLKAPPGLSVFVQKKGVIKLKDFKSHLRITGKKIGETKIKMGEQSQKVIVLGKRKYRTWRALKNWLSDKRGLSLEVTSQKISLVGEFLTVADFKELQKIKHPMEFLNRAVIPHRIEESVKSFALDVLQDSNLKPSDIFFSPYLKVSLSKKQKTLKKEFQKALSPFGVTPEIQHLSLSLVPIIKIKVIIAQVKRSFFRQWGVSWPTSMEAQVLGPNLNPPFSLKLSAQMLEQTGMGKVLASPTLITQSNKKAYFHSGGEIPIKSVSQFSHRVSWKKYGITLEILPQSDLNGHLRIDIKNEISMIDRSQMIDGVPALVRDEFHSVFNLKRPRPIIISGLFKKEWGESREGLPLLSQIPIFRHLFSNESQGESETELVFIVSPEVMEP